jgi:hypothetical protein
MHSYASLFIVAQMDCKKPRSWAPGPIRLSKVLWPAPFRSGTQHSQTCSTGVAAGTVQPPLSGVSRRYREGSQCTGGKSRPAGILQQESHESLRAHHSSGVSVGLKEEYASGCSSEPDGPGDMSKGATGVQDGCRSPCDQLLIKNG